jgi:hypothetical protein
MPIKIKIDALISDLNATDENGNKLNLASQMRYKINGAYVYVTVTDDTSIHARIREELQSVEAIAEPESDD